MGGGLWESCVPVILLWAVLLVQMERVMFALGRIPEGGDILADEVGLGKTIEAGLILAQSSLE